MKPCPHCNDWLSGFKVCGQMAGATESYFDENGVYSELNMDKAYWVHKSKVVRCANCNKIRRDVYIYDRTQIKEVE